ncbi:MAG: hypothetical protein QOJ61_3604, partial [Mycobacterium sp.]|nr:hypothetical protein [Mycobacterium sp.]
MTHDADHHTAGHDHDHPHGHSHEVRGGRVRAALR